MQLAPKAGKIDTRRTAGEHSGKIQNRQRTEPVMQQEELMQLSSAKSTDGRAEHSGERWVSAWSGRRLSHAEAAGGALTLDTEENEQKTGSRTEPLPAIRERERWELGPSPVAQSGDRPRQRPGALAEIKELQQRLAREPEGNLASKQNSNTKRESRPVDARGTDWTGAVWTRESISPKAQAAPKFRSKDHSTKWLERYTHDPKYNFSLQ
jgi:hypothetical protein